MQILLFALPFFLLTFGSVVPHLTSLDSFSPIDFLFIVFPKEIIEHILTDIPVTNFLLTCKASYYGFSSILDSRLKDWILSEDPSFELRSSLIRDDYLVGVIRRVASWNDDACMKNFMNALPINLLSQTDLSPLLAGRGSYGQLSISQRIRAVHFAGPYDRGNVLTACVVLALGISCRDLTDRERNSILSRMSKAFKGNGSYLQLTTWSKKGILTPKSSIFDIVSLMEKSALQTIERCNIPCFGNLF
jgi:hypothetical protein